MIQLPESRPHPSADRRQALALPLDAVRLDDWPADYTSDLIDLLHVLTGLVALEAEQAAVLDQVMVAR